MPSSETIIVWDDSKYVSSVQSYIGFAAEEQGNSTIEMLTV